MALQLFLVVHLQVISLKTCLLLFGVTSLDEKPFPFLEELISLRLLLWAFHTAILSKSTANFILTLKTSGSCS